MSNVFVIIKMCYVHNQWYDISCATLYILKQKALNSHGNEIHHYKDVDYVTDIMETAQHNSKYN